MASYCDFESKVGRKILFRRTSAVAVLASFCGSSSTRVTRLRCINHAQGNTWEKQGIRNDINFSLLRSFLPSQIFVKSSNLQLRSFIFTRGAVTLLQLKQEKHLKVSYLSLISCSGGGSLQ